MEIMRDCYYNGRGNFTFLETLSALNRSGIVLSFHSKRHWDSILTRPVTSIFEWRSVLHFVGTEKE